MNVDLDTVVVEHNEAAQRYEAKVDNYLALMQYTRAGDAIVFTHTEVPEALEGHGIANKLAKTALEQARAEHLAVVPLCRFLASYIRRHPEYREIVDPEYRADVS